MNPIPASEDSFPVRHRRPVVFNTGSLASGVTNSILPQDEPPPAELVIIGNGALVGTPSDLLR